MITENYMKMCEQAEEIQKWYKSDVKNVKEGDRYICQCKTCTGEKWFHYVKDSDIDYINERDMTDVGPTYVAMVDLSGVGEFGAFWDDRGFIYLPTQEQLQEMILSNPNADFQPLWLIFKFKFFTDRINIGSMGTGIENSMNELWLAFIMKELYHKIWNGEKWEKITNVR